MSKRLLIFTQKVDKNDPVLGFFIGWIEEFSKQFESVIVICLEKGEHNLPENVKVLSLGKEERQSRLQYLIHFYWYIWYERKNYDVVFVHMNQVYIALGGFLWRIWKKKITFWYTHRAVSMSLRIATLFANDIFTSAKESFNVRTKKLHIIGHAINIEQFERSVTEHQIKQPLRIISIGRITKIKNLETLVEAIDLLKKENIKVKCTIIGPKVTEVDIEYAQKIERLIQLKNLKSEITILEPVANEKIREYLWQNQININLTPTGGIDKVVLEGIAARVIPLVSNKAFRLVFGPYETRLIFELRNPNDLAKKIKDISSSPDLKILKEALFQKVQADFSLPQKIKEISDIIVRTK